MGNMQDKPDRISSEKPSKKKRSKRIQKTLYIGLRVWTGTSHGSYGSKKEPYVWERRERLGKLVGKKQRLLFARKVKGI